AHLAAVFDGVGERRANARIDLGVDNSHRRIEPSSSSGRPSGLERPNGGASSKLGIESDGVKARDAGEYLAADAARAEEPKRGIAFRSPVGDTQRSDRPARTNERLRRLFLREANVSTRFAPTTGPISARTSCSASVLDGGLTVLGSAVVARP